MMLAPGMEVRNREVMIEDMPVRIKAEVVIKGNFLDEIFIDRFLSIAFGCRAIFCGRVT